MEQVETFQPAHSVRDWIARGKTGDTQLVSQVKVFPDLVVEWWLCRGSGRSSLLAREVWALEFEHRRGNARQISFCGGDLKECDCSAMGLVRYRTLVIYKLSKLINMVNARGIILEYMLYIHVVNQLRAGGVIGIWVRISIALCHWVH